MTYVRQNQVEPGYLEGESLWVPASQEVEVFQVPQAEYQYAYINSVPVVADPGTRQIVYIVR